jgi:hypothetical protein
MATNYYVLGSSHYYDDNSKDDMYDYMVSNSVVSVAWAGNLDMNRFIGKPKNDIGAYLKSIDRADASPSLKIFLNLQPNDVIAIKKWEGPGGITVRAYASIIGKYSYDETKKRHNISAKYIIKDLQIPFPYNYAQTITRVVNPEYLRNIFEPERLVIK